jgi:hypothetical protein
MLERMSDELVNVTCPSCGQRCEAHFSAPQADPPRWDEPEIAAAVRCPFCEWEFVCNEHGEVADDGELDSQPLLTVTAEGELDADDLRQTTCPCCARRLEASTAEIEFCRGCQHHFVVQEAPFRAESYFTETGDEDNGYGPEAEEMLCPMCQDYGDLDGPEFDPLPGGWVQCRPCGWEFFAPDLCQELWDSHRRWGWAGRPRRVRYVVASDGSGDFRSLTAALDRVGERGELVVRPGTYAEPLVADFRRLKIVADGSPDEVRLVGGLKATAARLTVQGVTLTGPVVLHHTRALLERCEMGWSRQVGVFVSGSRSRVRLLHCGVRNCEQAAVSATRGAVLLLTDCQLSGNTGDGVLVEEGAWARLRRCHITTNRGAGVRVRPHNALFMHQCLIAENDGTGIALHGGRALLRDCRIVDQKATGITVGRRGRLLLWRCQLQGSRRDGLRLGRRVRAALVNCEITGNGNAGIAAGSGARAMLRRCAVDGNGLGLRLAASGRVGLRGCKFTDNGAGWDVAPGGVVVLHDI